MSPKTAKALLDAGYIVHVEKCPERIYKDEEFEAVGAELVPTGSWRDAPLDNIILGLKELPDVEAPLSHTHVTFLHVFKVSNLFFFKKKITKKKTESLILVIEANWARDLASALQGRRRHSIRPRGLNRRE